jgi:hypothetical protein
MRRFRQKPNQGEAPVQEEGKFYSLYRVFWFICAGLLGLLIFRGRNFWKNFKRGGSISNSTTEKSFFERLFDSPFLDDNEELRLRPVSVNTYVYILPTHHNEDGIFVKCLIENTSELATENVL